VAAIAPTRVVVAARRAVVGVVRVAAHAAPAIRGGPRLCRVWRVVYGGVARLVVEHEGIRPDGWDLPGSAIGLIGMAAILSGPASVVAPGYRLRPLVRHGEASSGVGRLFEFIHDRDSEVLRADCIADRAV